MKKIVRVLLCLTATVCLVAGCSQAEPAPSAKPSEAPTFVVSQPTTPPSTDTTPTTPTAEPSLAPSEDPTSEPTLTPTVEPTAEPTLTPTVEPSVEPTEPADPFANVAFVNRSVTYDGTRQKLEVTGAPDGAEIVYQATEENTAEDNVDVYTEDGAKKPGVYGVKAIVRVGDETREFTAKLTVRKARLTVKGDEVIKDAYAPDPELTYTVEGLMPGDEFVITPVAEPEEPETPSETPSLLPSASIAPSVDPSGIPEEQPESDNAKFYGELIITPESGRYSEPGAYTFSLEGVTSDCYTVTFRSGTLYIRGYETDLVTGVAGGLKQNNNGQMIYNGKVVEWQGINYFSLFAGCFSGGEVNEAAVQRSFAGLEELAACNVKAIRFSCGHFYARGWQSNWFGDSETGITRAEMNMYLLKRLFNKAASLNIGLIPSVYWTSNISGLFEGEEMSTGWGTEGSNTWNFAMEYQTMLLETLNNHPALFMWEFGNEWNLGVDVSGDVDETKRLTSDILHNFRSAWADLIESYNKDYKRVIATGDGMLRNCQYNKWKNSSWGHDTLDQHTESLKYLNPGITAVSVHIYGGAKCVLLQEAKIAERKAELGRDLTSAETQTIRNDVRRQYLEDPAAFAEIFESYGITDGYMGAYSTKIPNCETLTEYYNLILTASKTIGATAYVGETGIGYTYGETVLQNGEYAYNLGYYPDINYDDVTYYSEQVTKAQQATGMPLILYWNYEYDVNINRMGDDIYWGKGYLTNDNPNDDYITFNDHGTGTEYSMSLKYWEKARRVLAEVKKVNDAWDAKNA